MNGLLNRPRRVTPSVAAFYSDVAYGTRVSQATIKKMAEEVATSLAEVCDILDGVTNNGKELLRALKKNNAAYSIDQETQLVSNFRDAEERLTDLHDQLVKREDCAVCDPALHSNNEVVVVGAYKATMKKTLKLIQLIQNIRWEVMAQAEDYGVVCSEAMSADELIKSLG